MALHNDYTDRDSYENMWDEFQAEFDEAYERQRDKDAKLFAFATSLAVGVILLFIVASWVVFS